MTTQLLKSPASLKNSTIAFIGGGNMASSLIGGLISAGCDANNIRVSEPNDVQLDILCKHYHITPCDTNDDAVNGADVVVFAVKPQVLNTVCKQLCPSLQQHKPLILSIAAGVCETNIQQWVGGNLAIVRTMPNTPALIQTGASGLYANQFVNDLQHSLAESIMRAVGITHWVSDEQQMNAITAISGSGPAYFFYFMESMQKSAIALGLDAECARLFTLQTALGAAKMALESSESCHDLRKKVTSPGGTTEQAIQSFDTNKLADTVDQAVNAAYQKSIQLGELLGKNI